MKIFNLENSKSVVYFQVRDIELLKKLNIPIPKEDLITEIIKGRNKDDFIRTEDEELIKLFENIEYIADYGWYINSSSEGLIYLMKTYRNKLLCQLDILLDTNINKTEKDEELCEKTASKYKGLKDIIKIKNGISDIALPSAMSSSSRTYIIDKGESCLLKLGINQNEFYVYFDDGRTLEGNINDAIIASIENKINSIIKINGSLPILYEEKWELSEDNKVLRITINCRKKLFNACLKRIRKKE